MDPDIYHRLVALERDVQTLKSRDYATYNTVFAGSLPEDHFNKPTLASNWSWVAGAPYGGAPAFVSLSQMPSHLAVYGATGVGVWHYLARTVSGNDFAARLIPCYNNAQGIKADDGTENNYIYWYLEPGSDAGFLRLRTITRSGGGAVSQTTIVEGLPYHPIVLAINISGSGCFASYHLEPHLSSRPAARFFTFPSIAFTPTRAGLVFNPNTTAIQNTDTAPYFDWWSGT